MIHKNILFRKRIVSALIVLIFILFYSCELIDPTDVKNSTITEESLLENASGGGAPLVVGLKRQLAQAYGYLVQFSEVTSDNYINMDVNISTLLDNPRSIRPDDLSLDGSGLLSSSPYFHLQNLRALADFGLDVILQKDIYATQEQKALTHFYRGMALLLLSENFSAFPIKEKSGAITAKEASLIAVDEFKIALNLTSKIETKADCRLALARAYRIAGDKINAELEAKNLIALAPEHLTMIEYDPISLPNNVSYWVVLRPNNDMQPLPRLDFLDPKCPTDDSPIPILKAEEAFLILAEVAISNGNQTDAKKYMRQAIVLSDSREIGNFSDLDNRMNRPNNPLLKVKADASSPLIDGLIQKRGSGSAQVYLYPVSGTSLIEADIDGLISQTDIIRSLYLLRQEIFFLEGRRMSDLGIRWPVTRSETDANPYYRAGSPGTSVVVPSFIPAGKEMDAFSTDETAGIVTCHWDMNKLIALNYSLIKPF